MQIINSLDQISSNEKIGILIGNFDGVHLGHKDLIYKFISKCKLMNIKTCIITFVPHPYFIFNPVAKSYLLSTYEEKKRLLKECSLDYCVELEFSRDFSTMGADDFLIENILRHDGVGAIFAGYDFGFGSGKTGNYKLIEKYSKERAIYSEQGQRFAINGNAISSSIIRKDLKKGNVDEVESKLGRHYQISGRVIKGVGRGKLIGFPTANLNFDDLKVIPALGVYITKIEIAGMLHQSITNIGVNPTFEKSDIVHIETHIFSFDRDIYGESVNVHFFKRIRNEKKFKDVNELTTQIQIDCDLALEYFK